MRRQSEFREKLKRNSISQPASQLAETLSEETVAGDPATAQLNKTDMHRDQPASPPNIPSTDIQDFAYRFDHAALEINSTRWSNLPELIDLSKLQVERIPEDLFAQETMRQPKYTEDMVDAYPGCCQVVLAVFRCGNYAFFTAQCFDHCVITRKSNAKPVGVCNLQLSKQRQLLPYFCAQDTCPVCSELQESVSLVEVLQRKWLPK